jgi:hypothetical protein
MRIFGFQNKFWIPLAGCFRPKFILGDWESKIYFGRLGVQNLFWMTPTHTLLITPGFATKVADTHGIVYTSQPRIL